MLEPPPVLGVSRPAALGVLAPTASGSSGRFLFLRRHDNSEMAETSGLGVHRSIHPASHQLQVHGELNLSSVVSYLCHGSAVYFCHLFLKTTLLCDFQGSIVRFLPKEDNGPIFSLQITTILFSN